MVRNGQNSALIGAGKWSLDPLRVFPRTFYPQEKVACDLIINVLYFLGRGKGCLYDEHGILIAKKKDLCDCMEEACPGW